MTESELFNLLLGPLGLLVALIIVVTGAVREWWFTGKAYRRLEAERDHWIQLAMKSVAATDKAVTLVEPP